MLHRPTAFMISARPITHYGAVLSTLLCVAPVVHADGADVLTLSAAATFVQDSNLFRLPPDANFPALIGSDSAADQITITSVGIKLNKDYSLQRVELDLNLANYRYQNFQFLDNTAHNYSAAWRWSFTPRLRGNLTTGRQEILNDFSNVEGYTLSNERVNLTTRLDGTYAPGGPWRLAAGIDEVSQTNPKNQSAEADTVTRSVDAGVRYVYASGSQWAYTLRSANGSYLLSPNLTGLIDGRFEQIDHAVSLRWMLHGSSTANLQLTAQDRTHPQLVSRNYGGIGASANYNLSITGKTSVLIGLSRELGSYQTSTSNYAQTDRFILAPTWAISAKTLLRLRYSYSQRDYLGNPNTMSSNVLHRTDTLSDSALSFEWQPQPYLIFSAVFQDSRRRSNVDGLDFQSTSISLTAQISF